MLSRKTAAQGAAGRALQSAQREQSNADSAVQVATRSLTKHRDQVRALQTNINAVTEEAGEATLEAGLETTENGAEEYRECVVATHRLSTDLGQPAHHLGRAHSLQREGPEARAREERLPLLRPFVQGRRRATSLHRSGPSRADELAS